MAGGNRIYQYQFTDIVSTPGNLSARIQIPRSFPFFEGHFPEDPVVPAVCIVDASLELLSHHVPDLSKEDIRLKRSRFNKVIQPGEPIRIEAVEEAGKKWKFNWFADRDNYTMAQLYVLLQ